MFDAFFLFLAACLTFSKYFCSELKAMQSLSITFLASNPRRNSDFHKKKKVEKKKRKSKHLCENNFVCCSFGCLKNVRKSKSIL